MSPWLLLGFGAAWVGSVGAAGLWAYGAGKDAELAIQAREDKTRTITADAAASAAAVAISKISVTHRTIRQELQRDIVEKPVYRDPDCRTGTDSLRRFNSGIPGASQPSADPSKLPASDASH